MRYYRDIGGQPSDFDASHIVDDSTTTSESDSSESHRRKRHRTAQRSSGSASPAAVPASELQTRAPSVQRGHSPPQGAKARPVRPASASSPAPTLDHSGQEVAGPSADVLMEPVPNPEVEGSTPNISTTAEAPENTSQAVHEDVVPDEQSEDMVPEGSNFQEWMCPRPMVLPRHPGATLN